MRKFIYKLTRFAVPIMVFFVSGLFLPVTPRASQSLLFATSQKDELLLHVETPRIIFVGGSNLSFGLNSQMIKDELNINPINTGVHASIGLRYMLENTIQYIREGDIVILALEYSHFYRDYNYVSDELLRTIFDVTPSNAKLLNLQQAIGILSYLPEYTVSKFKPFEYFNITESDIYSVNSFNKYGDVDAHWEMNNRKFDPYPSIEAEFNQAVIDHILEFQTEIVKKNAVLFVTFPGFQASSYANSAEQIQKIAIEYKNNGLMILGYPEKYKIPEHMMFNTPYHLNKEGVDYRTRLFIDDYKQMNLTSQERR